VHNEVEQTANARHQAADYCAHAFLKLSFTDAATEIAR